MEIEKRNSKIHSKEIFESLYENVETRNYCLNILAESIIDANEVNPSSWSISLFDKKIRLNVGPVEVLVFSPQKIFIITSDLSEDINIENYKDVITPADIYYPSVQVLQHQCNLTQENIIELYPIFEDAHKYFIRLAATKRKRTPWYKSFSSGVINYLNDATKNNVPFPAYYSNGNDEHFLQPDEIPLQSEYYEGALTSVTVNSYERNNHARDACIKTWGYNCQCCGINFENDYGEIGKDFIHIHHKKPLSEISEKYQVQPELDLIPVCPNCHAMLHKRNPPFTIEELIQIRKSNKI